MSVKRKMLFFQWDSFMNRGIENALKKLEFDYDTFYFPMPQDAWEVNEKLAEELEEVLKTKEYAVLFSVNFCPVLSDVCENRGIPYISWIYDSPMHIVDEGAMKNSCNHMWMFDRGMVEKYQKRGIPVKHMTLAVDENAFQYTKGLSETGYTSDISFVGNLYQTDYKEYMSLLPEYWKGYLNGILESQSKIQGGYILDEAITEELVKELNIEYGKSIGREAFSMTRQLEYMMLCEITSRERKMLLRLLAKHFNVDLFSTEENPELPGVKCNKGVEYYSQMPEVFRNSKLNLNISLRAIRTGIPLRVLDIMGCGGAVLTNEQEEIAEWFTDGEDCIIYESMEDAFYKAQYYLQHETERKKIAERGLKRVRRDFRFEDKIRRMMQEIE